MTKGEYDGLTMAGRGAAGPRTDDAVGRVLGRRYRLMAPIGSGASAKVYAAEDLSLGRKVAIKCLRTDVTEDRRFVRRFRAEAKAAAQLNHPNLLAVYDWGEDPSASYLVTELLLGGTVRDMLDSDDLLTPSQALLVALQVAQGLKYAHSLGWVHRDIKPANLLFGHEGRLRIADFGIARAMAEAAWTEPEGVLIGTARYAAPEQAMGGTIDGKADVYSMALTIVESATGEVPLLRDNALGTMLLRQDEDVGDLSQIGPLGEPLQWAGKADPAARPSAAELIEALSQVARSLPRPRRLPLLGPAPGEAADADQPGAAGRGGRRGRVDDEPTVLLGSSRDHELAIATPTHRDEPTLVLSSRQFAWPPTGPVYEPAARFSPDLTDDAPDHRGTGLWGSAAPEPDPAAPGQWIVSVGPRDPAAAADAAIPSAPLGRPEPPELRSTAPLRPARVTAPRPSHRSTRTQHEAAPSSPSPSPAAAGAADDTPSAPEPPHTLAAPAVPPMSDKPDAGGEPSRSDKAATPDPPSRSDKAGESGVPSWSDRSGGRGVSSWRDRSGGRGTPSRSDRKVTGATAYDELVLAGAAGPGAAGDGGDGRSRGGRRRRLRGDGPDIVVDGIDIAGDESAEGTGRGSGSEKGTSGESSGSRLSGRSGAVGEGENGGRNGESRDKETENVGEGERQPGRGVVVSALLAFVVVLAVIGAGFLAVRATLGDEAAPTTAPLPIVGNYVGESFEDVEDDLLEWEVTVTPVRQDGTAAGQILAQRPLSNRPLETGGELELTVSEGQELRDVPSLFGTDVADANARLQQAALVLGVITQSHDDQVPEGQILAVRTDGADAPAQLETGTEVDLVVSLGPAAQPMPSFIGLTLEEAIDQADGLGFVLAREESYSETVPEGQVIDTDPPTETPVRPGDTVTVVVSLGLPFVVVPDVTGMDPAQAALTLIDAGFDVVDTDGPPNQPVTGTVPAAGESHRLGTEIVVRTTG